MFQLKVTTKTFGFRFRLSDHWQKKNYFERTASHFPNPCFGIWESKPHFWAEWTQLYLTRQVIIMHRHSMVQKDSSDSEPDHDRAKRTLRRLGALLIIWIIIFIGSIIWFWLSRHA